jgi:hypothetical protein
MGRVILKSFGIIAHAIRTIYGSNRWYHADMLIRSILRAALSFVLRGVMVLILLMGLTSSTIPLREEIEQIRRFTRNDEFEFVKWTVDALLVKLRQFSLGAAAHLSEGERKALVLEYLDHLREAQQLEGRFLEMLSVAGIGDGSDVDALRDTLTELRDQMSTMQPFVESILQDQVSYILSDVGFGAGGSPFPPVAFKFSQLPVTLIVSPREVIRQDANIPLVTTLTLDEKIELENAVAENLDVSTYVTNIGGIGTFPTMVLESTSLGWVFETVIHEWVHNYLLLRPLGWVQLESPELRTMNETTAALVGGALGREVITRYYPELAPPPPQPQLPQPPTNEPPVFDFGAEMHETRITADELLAEGKIEAAEQYMEARRLFFWENGYHLRKLNQAYFAFHGAYADRPQGASGADPVGEAVRDLWEALGSPVDFLRQMALMNDVSDLFAALNQVTTTG